MKTSHLVEKILWKKNVTLFSCMNLLEDFEVLMHPTRGVIPMCYHRYPKCNGIYFKVIQSKFLEILGEIGDICNIVIDIDLMHRHEIFFIVDLCTFLGVKFNPNNTHSHKLTKTFI